MYIESNISPFHLFQRLQENTLYDFVSESYPYVKGIRQKEGVGFLM